MSDIGLNLRLTSGYVTDPANTTYFLAGADAYPTTRGGFTFGWTVNNWDPRDRNAGVDARLAGMAANASATTKAVAQLDLTAGNYDIQLACGDYSYTRTLTVEVLDNTTSRFTISGTTTGANRWLDALGAQHDTTWVPSSAEAKTNQSISTGTLIFKAGDGVSTNTGYLSHIRATTTAGSSTLGLGKLTQLLNAPPFLAGVLLLKLSRRNFLRSLWGLVSK